MMTPSQAWALATAGIEARTAAATAIAAPRIAADCNAILRGGMSVSGQRSAVSGQRLGADR
jgi:hypothetical protein